MPLQISTLKFWINLEPLDYFRLIGTARGGRSFVPAHGGSYGMGDLGDATRIRWLQEHLRMNGLSPIKYEIIESKTSVAGQGFGGSSHRVYYVIKAIKENVGMK